MMYEVAPANSSKALISIEDYVEVVRRRKWVVLGGALMGLLVAFAYAQSRTASYDAEATVLVNATPVGSSNNNLLTPNLDREASVLNSDAIAESVLAKVDAPALDRAVLRNGLSIGYTEGSDVIDITFTDGDPSFAASVANAYAAAYVDTRVAEQTDYYTSQIGALDREIEALNAARNDLFAQLDAIEAQVSQLAQQPALSAQDRNDQIGSANAARSAAQGELGSLNGRLRTIETDRSRVAGIFDSQAPAAKVLSTAGAPTTPNGLGTGLLLAGGTLLGLILGISAAAFVERLDSSADTPEEVSLALGTTVMGTVPQFLGWRGAGTSGLIMRSEAKNARVHQARESFRRLRTAIEYLMRTSGVRTILITSSKPNEGKSVVSANLATALALSGMRVALINGDMRRPTLELLFGIDNSPTGLSGYLGGLSDDFDPRVLTDIKTLALVPSGPQPDNPGELLTSERFTAMLRELKEQVDLVIIDTPPLGATADAAAASAAVDGVIVLVDSRRATMEELESSRADLDRAGAKVLGAVLNRYSTDARSGGRKSSYYNSASRSA